MPHSDVYRIYVARTHGLRPLPGDYEDLEAARKAFEKDHGEIRWCLVSRIDLATERPTPVLHAEAAGAHVEWHPLL